MFIWHNPAKANDFQHCKIILKIKKEIIFASFKGRSVEIIRFFCASIVLAKDVLNGRQIAQARLEKLLPGYKLDGSKYEYVKDRAQKIAETCRAKYLNAKRDIDQSLQLGESDYYWNSEQMEKIYDSFRKDGEAYGEAKQKIIALPQCSKR